MSEQNETTAPAQAAQGATRKITADDVLRLNLLLMSTSPPVGDPLLEEALGILNPDVARRWLVNLHFARVRNEQVQQAREWTTLPDSPKHSEAKGTSYQWTAVLLKQIYADIKTAENLLWASLHPEDEVARIATLASWANGELDPGVSPWNQAGP